MFWKNSVFFLSAKTVLLYDVFPLEVDYFDFFLKYLLYEIPIF